MANNGRGGTHAADRWFTCGQGFTIHRRYEQPKRKEIEKGASVGTNVADICDKTPTDRLKWLENALIDAAHGRLKASVVLEIIEDRFFSDGLDIVVGDQMNALVHSNLHLFSNQQQKQITSAFFPLNEFGIMADQAERGATAGRQRKRRGQETSMCDEDARGRRHIVDEDRKRRREPQGRDNAVGRIAAEEDPREERMARGEELRDRRPGQERTEDCREDRTPRAEARRDRRPCQERRREERHGCERRRRPESSEEIGVRHRRKRTREIRSRKEQDGNSAASGSDASVDNAEVAANGIVSGIEVWEETKEREQSLEARAGAKFLGNVLDQLKSVGLHARQNWSATELGVCKKKMASLKQELLGDTHSAEFEERLAGFQAGSKKETSLVFLQYSLSLLRDFYMKDREMEAALFLALTVIVLQTKSLRVALNERALTLKKQLEEGFSS